jgi:phosphatidylglycerophosphatase A
MRIVTTFGYVGLLRPAPGTWGSAVALGLGLLIDRYLGAPALALAFVAVTMLGFWACARELADRPGDDPAEIVIDEVAGQWLALLFPALAFYFGPGKDGFLPWPAWVGAFAMFRLFDIRKPWLVGRADRRHDPAGVMLDDLWAGLFAGICVIIAGVIWHLVVL